MSRKISKFATVRPKTQAVIIQKDEYQNKKSELKKAKGIKKLFRKSWFFGIKICEWHK